MYRTDDGVVAILKDPVRRSDAAAVRRLEKKYAVAGVTRVGIVTLNAAGSRFARELHHKNVHCFCDIDSTLTRGDGVIGRGIRSTFSRMKADNMRIYLASGRSISQLGKAMRKFATEEYGIAENGGIILGLGDDGEIAVGSRDEPDRLDGYLKSNCPGVREDIPQGMRKTERIYTKSALPRRKLDAYVKKSGARVEIHEGKSSYHVSKRKVNKGTAVARLTSELHFGELDTVVAVGDADMDAPMFREAAVSFAVGNSSPLAKSAASVVLENDYDKGIAEMHSVLRDAM